MVREVLVAVIASIATAAILWFAEKIGRTLVIAVPSDAVVAFDATKCPDGWEEYRRAYGRFIRGVDNSEQGIDPAGKRATGHHQEDALQEHNHSATYHQANTTGSRPHRNFEYPVDGGNATFTTTQMVGARPSQETRPKNVALLYCEKN